MNKQLQASKFFFFFLMFFCKSLFSQTVNDLLPYESFSNSRLHSTSHEYITEKYRDDRPLQNILKGFHFFYKHFIASQDASKCPFQISCSNYFIYSIDTNGIFLGVLDGADRLLRCNGLSHDMYDLDYETGMLIDEVPLLKRHKHE
ncbi:MAG: membrane protein insertion efficiency factor YidD [Bacteroidales bacterium]|nr:membrane protein insertion efficiency factor YidD [Bacteroidales bacterium]